MNVREATDLGWVGRVLYTAVVADVLDTLGLRHQALAGAWQSASGHGLLAGWARTTQWEDLDRSDPRPYELELAAVDSCLPGDVLVAAAGGSLRSGIWGELLSTAASRRGCRGALIDGAVRDVKAMHQLEFRVVARGTCPLDSLHRQRVTAVDVPVVVAGVTIEPNDLVLADDDGVVVVPRGVAEEVLNGARRKVEAENTVRDEIRAGASATEVFRKHGVL